MPVPPRAGPGVKDARLAGPFPLPRSMPIQAVGPVPWHRQLARRFVTLWFLKMTGTMAWIAVFFWLYFSVMNHAAPGAVMRTMPFTAVDAWFGVHEWALVPYASLWVYASLAAVAVGWALAKYAFEFEWRASPWVPLAGAVAGALLALAAGWWALRGVLQRPVVQTLREAGEG